MLIVRKEANVKTCLTDESIKYKFADGFELKQRKGMTPVEVGSALL